MKKYLLIVFLIGGMASAALAQQEHSNEHLHVPAVVKKANFEKYPDSKSYHITWEKEQGNYEANWGGKDGEANSVTYSPSVKFVEIVQAIPASQLPKAIHLISRFNIH